MTERTLFLPGGPHGDVHLLRHRQPEMGDRAHPAGGRDDLPGEAALAVPRSERRQQRVRPRDANLGRRGARRTAQSPRPRDSIAFQPTSHWIRMGADVSYLFGPLLAERERDAPGESLGGRRNDGLYRAPLRPLHEAPTRRAQAPPDWEDVRVESTYVMKPHETNAIKFRAYTSWSPWRSPLFLRAEVLISKDSASACVGIGYLW